MMRKWRHPILSVLAMVALIAAALPLAACQCSLAGSTTTMTCSMEQQPEQPAMACCAKMKPAACCNMKPATPGGLEQSAILPAAQHHVFTAPVHEAKNFPAALAVLPDAPLAITPNVDSTASAIAHTAHLWPQHAPPVFAGRAPPSL